VRVQVDAVGSEDVTYKLAPGGHMGVFSGATAPKYVWQPLAEWLSTRSAARPVRERPARTPIAHRASRGPQRARRAAQH
jgi:hypothetical protein